MWRGLIVNAFVIFWGAIPLAVQAAESAATIVVTGTGQVQAAPDISIISLGVAHEGGDPREAMNRVSEDMGNLFKQLTDMGIAPRDVQTTSIRLDPLWQDRSRSTPQEKPEIVGFVARNEISVRLRDLERLGEVLHQLVEDGANRFSGVRFAMNDAEPLLDDARRKAVADARRKAELYAQAAGVKLGPVISLSEPESGHAPVAVFSARAESVPVAAGELDFSARVTIVYEIAN